MARATLAARAVALYKHDDVTALDAIFGADDFGDLVSRLTMVQSIAHGDRDVLRTVERTKRELADRAVSLVADERTAEEARRPARRGAQEHQGAARPTGRRCSRECARRSATSPPNRSAGDAHARRDGEAAVRRGAVAVAAGRVSGGR